MEGTPRAWHPALADPSGRRQAKPRRSGKTMVIDKGLGLSAFKDLLETSAAHIDMIKIGFGTSPLYPQTLLKRKIELAKQYDICMFPGGTFLEVAVAKEAIDAYFKGITELGFDGVEVSDGTIELPRDVRSRLIAQGIEAGLTVYTEYGKKCWGSTIETEELIRTVRTDVHLGAELVTIEGRESGAGVGIFDANGECRDDQIHAVLDRIDNPGLLLWEAPQKSQQVHLLNLLGPDINIGNVAPQDIMSLEALRRGLRSDTFDLIPGYKPRSGMVYELTFEI
ncbi:phosphosulfolactate synthase [Paenibacillus sp. MBLB4367]|uniref:phosphosulfolactate synthase n=1 Tax=Paenibacillus sp. MBLB4367 TaxID=3384767 RepID=UPI003908291D